MLARMAKGSVTPTARLRQIQQKLADVHFLRVKYLWPASGGRHCRLTMIGPRWTSEPARHLMPLSATTRRWPSGALTTFRKWVESKNIMVATSNNTAELRHRCGFCISHIRTSCITSSMSAPSWRRRAARLIRPTDSTSGGPRRKPSAIVIAVVRLNAST